VIGRNPFVVSCFLFAGLAGCGAARPANMVSSTSRATPVHEEKSARRGLAPVEMSGGPFGKEGDKHDDGTPTIVIGFVGGFVRHTDSVHSPVQVAARLRAAYPAGVYVEVFENRRRGDARRRILEILEKTRGGKAFDDTKQQARVVIYGMSWGGSETVVLARELQQERIPVLLTVQVDSVAKMGQSDEVIPSNVSEAANFYQTDGLLHGQREIRAEDAAHTRILGNFHYEYKAKSLNCGEYPWYDRLFTKYHTEIECDPEVWNRVETLIRAKLPATEAGAQERASQRQK